MQWFRRWLAIHALELDLLELDATVRVGETLMFTVGLDPPTAQLSSETPVRAERSAFSGVMRGGQLVASVLAEWHRFALPGEVGGRRSASVIFDESNSRGCASDYAEDISGLVLVVLRGNCTFVLKALNAERRRAVGLVIVNDDGRKLPMTMPLVMKMPVPSIPTYLVNFDSAWLSSSPEPVELWTEAQCGKWFCAA